MNRGLTILCIKTEAILYITSGTGGDVSHFGQLVTTVGVFVAISAGDTLLTGLLSSMKELSSISTLSLRPRVQWIP